MLVFRISIGWLRRLGGSVGVVGEEGFCWVRMGGGVDSSELDDVDQAARSVRLCCRDAEMVDESITLNR